MSEQLVIDSAVPTEVSLTIGGKEYLLREATGEVRAKYHSSLARGSKVVGNVMEHGPSVGDSEPLLVSLCLFERYDNQGESKSRPVMLRQVLDWKASVVRRLFDEVKRISPGLLPGEENSDKESAKN